MNTEDYTDPSREQIVESRFSHEEPRGDHTAPITLTDAFPVNEQTNSPKPSEAIYPSCIKGIIRQVAAGALVLSAFGQTYGEDPLLIPEVITSPATEHGLPPVSPNTLNKIDHLAAQPNPDLERLYRTYNKSVFELPPAEQKKVQAEQSIRYWNFAAKQAEKTGLHLINPEVHYRDIENADSPKQVVDQISQYTRELGFDTTMPNQTDLLDTGFGVEAESDPSTIDLLKLKEGAKNMLGALGLMPKELYDYIDIREARIVARLNERTSGVTGAFTPAGEANPVSGVIYLPIKYMYTGNFDLVMHEIAHRADYRMNGLWGMFHDTCFNALNPPGFEYDDPANPYIYKAVNAPYAATNEAEDKATLYEVMLNGVSRDIVNSPQPVIRAKYRELLGRLEQKIPGIATYLFNIASNPT